MRRTIGNGRMEQTDTRLYFPELPFDSDNPCKKVFSISCILKQLPIETLRFKLSSLTANNKNTISKSEICFRNIIAS